MYFLQSILNVLFPSACACCGETLMQGERQICLNCLDNLSQTLYTTGPDDNPIERLFAGRADFEHAISFYHFRKGNTVQKLVHAMKFHSNDELCLMMGRQMGLGLLSSGAFDDVDLLVPVPLHWRRRLQRGFNQSELLCRGIAQNFPRPINNHALARLRNTHKQSQQAADERDKNVEGAFFVKHPEELEGHHILLVDDVLTTGATLGSCCNALASVSNLRISIATLSVASQ